MTAPSPLTDPLWAYDVPGWTSQGNTGDTIGTNLAFPGTGAELVEPSALSGYITRNLDPDVTTVGGGGSGLTLTSGTAFLSAVQVMGPALTSSVIVNVKTQAATPTYSALALYNAVTGQQVAATATTAGNFTGTGVKNLSWVTPTVISSGYYWVLALSIAATGVVLTSFSLSAESQVLLTATGVTNYVMGKSLRFATGTTGLSALAAIPTALTGSMVVSATASSWFAGLA